MREREFGRRSNGERERACVFVVVVVLPSYRRRFRVCLCVCVCLCVVVESKQHTQQQSDRTELLLRLLLMHCWATQTCRRTHQWGLLAMPDTRTDALTT